MLIHSTSHRYTLGPVRTQQCNESHLPAASASLRPKPSSLPLRPLVFANPLLAAVIPTGIEQRSLSSCDDDHTRRELFQPSQPHISSGSSSDDQFQSGEDGSSQQQQHDGDNDSEREDKLRRIQLEGMQGTRGVLHQGQTVSDPCEMQLRLVELNALRFIRSFLGQCDTSNSWGWATYCIYH
jgi:hypothetical protein